MIDMRSDTVTKPTPAMRQAMAEAEVGDDVLDGDPTVMRLEARVADMLGKERALFVPTGTMGNQIALWVLGEAGTEVLLDANAHIIHWEMAGAAALSGLQIRPVSGSGTVMTASDLALAIRSNPFHPSASVVALENTHNHAGGKMSSAAELAALGEVARAHSLPVHLDGARLWNASVATGESLATLASAADTVMVSFAKGLGAPVGAALAGSAALIARAKVARKRFGGGMRQSGILAAGALFGLEHHIERLADDHENARVLAAALRGAPGVNVLAPDTNIVMVDLPPRIEAATLAARAREQDVLVSAWTKSRMRAVLHLDVSSSDAQKAGAVLRGILDS